MVTIFSGMWNMLSALSQGRSKMTDYTKYAFYGQLETYYKRIGFTGDLLDDAVSIDVSLVVANTNMDDIYPTDKLHQLFIWEGTEQGHKYWSMRNT